jgi:tetratricopeptide (TPR) repeat protein
MTKTKVLAIFVLVVGSLLYLKSVLYPPVPPWEAHHRAGLTAYRDKNYSEAEKQFKAALVEAESFSTDDQRLTLTLGNLVELYRVQTKHSQATPYFQRLLEDSEKNFGPDHPNVAAHLNNLAGNYRVQGKLVEAEPLYKRALGIWEKNLGSDNALTLFALKNYVDLLHEMGRDAEVESYQSRLKGTSPQIN